MGKRRATAPPAPQRTTLLNFFSRAPAVKTEVKLESASPYTPAPALVKTPVAAGSQAVPSPVPASAAAANAASVPPPSLLPAQVKPETVQQAQAEEEELPQDSVFGEKRAVSLPPTTNREWQDAELSESEYGDDEGPDAEAKPASATVSKPNQAAADEVAAAAATPTVKEEAPTVKREPTPPRAAPPPQLQPPPSRPQVASRTMRAAAATTQGKTMPLLSLMLPKTDRRSDVFWQRIMEKAKQGVLPPNEYEQYIAYKHYVATKESEGVTPWRFTMWKIGIWQHRNTVKEEGPTVKIEGAAEAAAEEREDETEAMPAKRQRC